MDAQGILPEFRGTAIHDHWKSYYNYDQCAHGECNAHHLRHLQYLHENLGIEWAGEMACLLLRIKKHVDLSKAFGADRLEQADIEDYERMYRDILDNAKLLFPKLPKGTKESYTHGEARRMATRLSEYEQETLLFMIDFLVPFDNNQSERDLRMPKAKQKISGCFRTEEGVKSFARVRGFISTAKKKGKRIIDGLVSIFKGNPREFLYPKRT